MARITGKPYWNTCGVPRTKLVSYSSLDTQSGEVTKDTKPSEWIMERCGIPLFSSDHEDTGMCRGCKEGFHSPRNFRVAGPIEPPDYRRNVR